MLPGWATSAIESSIRLSEANAESFLAFHIILHNSPSFDLNLEKASQENSNGFNPAPIDMETIVILYKRFAVPSFSPRLDEAHPLHSSTDIEHSYYTRSSVTTTRCISLGGV